MLQQFDSPIARTLLCFRISAESSEYVQTADQMKLISQFKYNINILNVYVANTNDVKVSKITILSENVYVS